MEVADGSVSVLRVVAPESSGLEFTAVVGALIGMVGDDSIPVMAATLADDSTSVTAGTLPDATPPDAAPPDATLPDAWVALTAASDETASTLPVAVAAAETESTVPVAVAADETASTVPVAIPVTLEILVGCGPALVFMI